MFLTAMRGASVGENLASGDGRLGITVPPRKLPSEVRNVAACLLRKCTAQTFFVQIIPYAARDLLSMPKKNIYAFLEGITFLACEMESFENLEGP